MNRYYTGFAMVVDATLTYNGVALTQSQIAAITTIEAAIVTTSRTLATGSVKVTCTKPGNGTVRATWSAGQTAGITPGRYLVEFRTSDGPYCHDGVLIDLIAGVSP